LSSPCFEVAPQTSSEKIFAQSVLIKLLQTIKDLSNLPTTREELEKKRFLVSLEGKTVKVNYSQEKLNELQFVNNILLNLIGINPTVDKNKVNVYSSMEISLENIGIELGCDEKISEKEPTIPEDKEITNKNFVDKEIYEQILHFVTEKRFEGLEIFIIEDEFEDHFRNNSTLPPELKKNTTKEVDDNLIPKEVDDKGKEELDEAEIEGSKSNP